MLNSKKCTNQGNKQTFKQHRGAKEHATKRAWFQGATHESHGHKKTESSDSAFLLNLERETRFELATPTLARLCSTTELFPLMLQLSLCNVALEFQFNELSWHPVGDSNPCYRRERAVS